MKNQIWMITALLSVLLSNATFAQEHQHKQHVQPGHATATSLAKMYEDPKRDALEQPERVLAYMGELAGKKVFDLGAGTGYYSVRLARHGAAVIAADVDDGFQQYIKDRIKKDKLSGIELRKVEFDDPKLSDWEVDIVFMANVYHHINDRAQYLSKVKKGIKTNGQLVILDYFDSDLPENIIAPPANMRVSIDKLIAELKAAGFTSFEVNVSLLDYQYIVKAR